MMTLFDFLYPKYKITKPIKLIELFAGYGSQALALKYLGIPFTHHKICEWAIPSIIAYADLHRVNNNDYTLNMSKSDIASRLFDLGVSSDYNAPATLAQLNRMSEDKLKLIYNSIMQTNNLVNISNVKGRDLDFADGEVIMTYSFPCQDLSLAGLGAGMSKGSGTRSGLLWEVERILAERERESLPLPNILIMENVPQIISKNNIDDFNKWQLKLEELGYTNYHELLNAKDYGIPQNRNRCFMVSILGEYSYSFPEPVPLKLKLKDLLEDEVSEKYYLSNKQITDIQGWNSYEKPLDTMEKVEKSGISPTLTTRTGAYAAGMILLKEKLCDEMLENGDLKEGDVINHSYSNYRMDKQVLANNDNPNCSPALTTRPDTLGVVVVGNYSPSGHNASRVVDPKGIAPTVMENHGTITAIPIKNANSKGFLLAEEGDGVDISGRMEYHRGTVQKGITQTLSTSGGNNNGVVVRKNTNNYIEWEEPGRLDVDCRAWKEDSIAPTTTTTPKSKVLLNNLRIRKLTPLECWRLMGVKDEDYEKVAKNQTASSLYHLAGDSIVVNVLMKIFKEFMEEENGD